MDNKIPKDLRERLSLPWYLKTVLYLLLFLTRLFRRYEYPRVHDPTVENIRNGVYGVSKSMRPVVHAQKGSGLEKYFKNEQKKPKKFLPSEFIPEYTASMTFCGDLMKNDIIRNSRNTFYQNVAHEIFDDDISVANLESTLTLEKIDQTTYQYKETPQINATLDDYLAMVGHRDKQFSLFHLANNHILDRGFEGYQTTVKRLEQDGILHFGTNITPENQKSGLIYEVKGIQFGFVGFTYSLNLKPMPEDMPYLINYIPFHNPKIYPDLSPLKIQIENLRKKGCDLVVVSLHWGIEYEFFPTPRQVEIAHYLSEKGADLIVCHHPHCIQPYEFYQTDRDPDRIVPILYSLGNLSANKSNPHIVLNLISKIKIAKGSCKNEQKTFIQNIDLIPVFQHEIVPDNAEDRYLQIERLRDQVNKVHSDKEYQYYLEVMGKYADLVIGTSWRKNEE
ncbi:MAG: CapA family protein [Candidatus Lokiarchaeota archaeon]|nr:CapA family protein [Candidatus Lokiarchaeota archaeon]